MVNHATDANEHKKIHLGETLPKDLQKELDEIIDVEKSNMEALLGAAGDGA